MPRGRLTPTKDKSSVYPDGSPRAKTIVGLNIRRLMPVEDHRGHIVEMFRSSWGLTKKPIAYAYQVTLRAGSVRGWVVHYKQEDRMYICRGTAQWAFYDDRPRSPTRGLVNVRTFSEQNRAMFVIPPGVYHAVKNVGEGEAILINMPSRPYHHASPDKYRISMKAGLIPFQFPATGGG